MSKSHTLICTPAASHANHIVSCCYYSQTAIRGSVVGFDGMTIVLSLTCEILPRGACGNRHGGGQDPRAAVLKDILGYISSRQPKTFVLENVPGIKSKKHRTSDGLCSVELSCQSWVVYVSACFVMDVQLRKTLPCFGPTNFSASGNDKNQRAYHVTWKVLLACLLAFNFPFDDSWWWCMFALLVTILHVSFFANMQVVDSRRFGLPQRRRRLYILGSPRSRRPPCMRSKMKKIEKSGRFSQWPQEREMAQLLV